MDHCTEDRYSQVNCNLVFRADMAGDDDYTHFTGVLFELGSRVGIQR